MEPGTYLRCLGQPALLAANGMQIRFRTKKHFALLLFLTVDGRKIYRRDRLAEFLWPRASTAEARHSLATALSILRPRLTPGALETTRDQVSLKRGHLTLDLDRLLAGQILSEENESQLEVAAFLDGFEIPDAPEFAIWKDSQQARLLPTIKAGIVVLIDRCRRTGDSKQIEDLADRMLALDELSEEAIRGKMEARALAGDRLTALRVFEEWKGRLAETLQAAPSDLVEGMAIRLRRRGWERTTRIDIPTVPTDQWKDRRFIGRTAEYRALYEAWDAARGGGVVGVLVLGDSGVGKSTLVERLTTAAGLEGSVVSRVQCYDLEREIPYAAVSSLVLDLIERPGSSGTPPESLAELARLVPEIRRRFAMVPPAVETQGETARIRLTEAFQELLHAVAEEHPLILVVDDVHLADDASLAVLHLVLRRLKELPLLVILIARPGELRSSPQASQLRDTAIANGIREVEVAPLSETESRTLLEALCESDAVKPSPTTQRALLCAAAGFPMVVELLFQDWQTHGDHSLALTVDSMTPDLTGSSSPPQLYREALGRLVRSLDPCTRSVLNLASVLGHRLNDMVLYSVADLSVGQTMTGMADLVARRVLRDGGKGLEFVNELLRTAAYLGIPSPVRRLLHSNIADYLTARDEATQQSLGLEIAWHCMRGGRLIEATPHLLCGAKSALRAGAPYGAERALVSAMPALGGNALYVASILLAEVMHEQGRSHEAISVLSSLDPLSHPHHADRIIALDALIRTTLGAASRAGLEHSLPVLASIVRQCDDVATKAMAGRAMAYITGETRDHTLTKDLITLLETIPLHELSADSIGELALARALLLFNNGNSQSAYEQAIAGIEELRRREAANLVVVQLLSGLGTIMLREGRYEEALRHYGEGFQMATRLGNDRQTAMVAGNISLCHGRLGNYEEQLRWASKAPAFTSSKSNDFLEIQITYSSAFAHAMLGRPDLALPAIQALQQRLLGDLPGWMVQAWGLWRADLLLLCGMEEEASSAAYQTLAKDDFALLSLAFAGPYARWLSDSTAHGRESKCARSVLEGMRSNLDRYDALDQVDILLAIDRMDSLDGGHSTEGTRIETQLELLPGAIRDQARRLNPIQPSRGFTHPSPSKAPAPAT